MPKVLIVDDDPAFRFMFAELLKYEGHDVIEAGSGQECMALLTHPTNPLSPSVIVLDYQMAPPNGADLVGMIRKLKGGRNIPLIMLTGDDGIMKEVVEMWGVRYLSKGSNTVEEIFSAVTEVIPKPPTAS